MESGSGPAQRIRSNEIPARNPNFTGRIAELETLRANLHDQGGPRPPVRILSGMGGTGKTEIATEDIHRNREWYDIIWWIRAEHHDRVRDALVRLGEKLELRQAIAGSGREQAIAAVLETLESGAQPSWLLVYDNAAQPLELQRYLPRGLPGGHIIITTRLPAWPGYVRADHVEVSLFSADEAVSLLRRRVSALAAGDDLDAEEDVRRAAEAGRPAAVLGGLPIATEHAAAYLAATDQSTGDDIARFEEYLSRLDRAALGVPGPGRLGDVDDAAEPGRRAPVQPVCLLLSGADRGRTPAGKRRGRGRAARAGRGARRLTPVPRRSRPVGPAVAGQGRRCAT